MTAEALQTGGYVAVCRADELAPGRMRWVGVKTERVLLANVEGGFYAVSDQCGHQFASLSRGRLKGFEVECPLHFARFDLRTGRQCGGPDGRDINCYRTLVVGDEVWVKAASE